MNNKGLNAALKTIAQLYDLDHAQMARFAKRDKYLGNDEGNERK